MLTILLHLLPLLMVLVTWQEAWSAAFEKIVRAQVLATLAYFLLYPAVSIFGWPGFQLADLRIGTLVDYWSGDGVLGTLPVISAAIVTMLLLFLRHRCRE